VFAKSAGKAKSLALEWFNSTFYDVYLYTDIQALRRMEFDGLFDNEFVVDSNDYLPKDKPFYSDDL